MTVPGTYSWCSRGGLESKSTTNNVPTRPAVDQSRHGVCLLYRPATVPTGLADQTPERDSEYVRPTLPTCLSANWPGHFQKGVPGTSPTVLRLTLQAQPGLATRNTGPHGQVSTPADTAGPGKESRQLIGPRRSWNDSVRRLDWTSRTGGPHFG